MTCLPQEFLRHGGHIDGRSFARGTLEDLESLLGIKHKRHTQYPNLVQLKYSQIASPMGYAIVRQCRGLILDQDDDWRVVARPFDKFFNHGEPHAAAIDWSTATVQEKVDGSLCILYWYDGEWRAATSGTPDADGPVNAEAMTFRELFWDTWIAAGYDFPRDTRAMTATDHTYMFELCSKHNRVVVRHDEPTLTLIGVRHTTGGDEREPRDFNLWQRWRRVGSFPLQSMADIEASFATMSPLAQEGYVVCDAAFNRVKVKHPGYVAIHHIKDGFGARAILEAVRSGETPEILAHFPEWQHEFTGIMNGYAQLCAELDADYERIRGIDTQKAFAFEALKTRCSAALFQRRSGRVSDVREFLSRMPIGALMETLGLRGEKAEAA